MRVRGARLLRARDRAAPVVLAGSVRAEFAPASVAVDAQQRFLAYAAHELRGEIALQRTLAEVALADPDADTAALREMGERVVVACERQERLLEALLTLARSECGRLRREPVDLAATAAERAASPRPSRTQEHHRARARPDDRRAAAGRAPRREPGRQRRPSQHPGRPARNRHVHRRRTRQLHDREHGTRDPGRRAHPPVPTLPATQLSRSATPADGVGLGLTIVQAIAKAHDATVTAQAPTGGGLRIDVAFPALD